MPNALRLYAVTANDHGHAIPENGAGEDGTVAGGGSGGTELMAFRDLAAIVAPTEYVPATVTGEAIEEHRRVVDGVFHRAPVLPAPVGTVFRSKETLLRWMELHYVALTEALNFVEDRAVARVHVRRDDGKEEDSGADLAAAAAEAFRALRRQSVAAVPLKSEHLTGIVLSSAFLLDKELWSEFVAAVEEQRHRNESLQFDLSGPWPPFDFVRMQFGG
jgi:Gas vesicle synthesis protein GvpL/GvpF